MKKIPTTRSTALRLLRKIWKSGVSTMWFFPTLIWGSSFALPMDAPLNKCSRSWWLCSCWSINSLKRRESQPWRSWIWIRANYWISLRKIWIECSNTSGLHCRHWKSWNWRSGVLMLRKRWNNFGFLFLKLWVILYFVLKEAFSTINIWSLSSLMLSILRIPLLVNSIWNRLLKKKRTKILIVLPIWALQKLKNVKRKKTKENTWTSKTVVTAKSLLLLIKGQ